MERSLEPPLQLIHEGFRRFVLLSAIYARKLPFTHQLTSVVPSSVIHHLSTSGGETGALVEHECVS